MNIKIYITICGIYQKEYLEGNFNTEHLRFRIVEFENKDQIKSKG